MLKERECGSAAPTLFPPFQQLLPLLPGLPAAGLPLAGAQGRWVSGPINAMLATVEGSCTAPSKGSFPFHPKHQPWGITSKTPLPWEKDREEGGDLLEGQTEKGKKENKRDKTYGMIPGLKQHGVAADISRRANRC